MLHYTKTRLEIIYVVTDHASTLKGKGKGKGQIVYSSYLLHCDGRIPWRGGQRRDHSRGVPYEPPERWPAPEDPPRG